MAVKKVFSEKKISAVRKALKIGSQIEEKQWKKPGRVPQKIEMTLDIESNTYTSSTHFGLIKWRKRVF